MRLFRQRQLVQLEKTLAVYRAALEQIAAQAEAEPHPADYVDTLDGYAFGVAHGEANMARVARRALASQEETDGPRA